MATGLRGRAHVNGLNMRTVRNARRPAFDRCDVTVIVYGYSRRLDPTNCEPMVKPIIDGLTDAGWWADDSPDHVVSVTYRAGNPVPRGTKRSIIIVAKGIINERP
jgi:hypothetical protein